MPVNKSVVKQSTVLLALLIVAAVTVAAAAVQGNLRNRWGQSQSMAAAAAKLEKMPEKFGNWQMKSSEKMEQSVVDMLECAGSVVRRYVHAKTGEAVNVTVIVGPAGPTAVHTPEICMSSRAYKPSENRHVVVVKDAAGGEHRFWSLAFKAEDLRGGTLRMMYAWSDGSQWQAPADARFAFAGRPYLYKIQLSSALPTAGNPAASDACQRFLEDLLSSDVTLTIDPSEKH